MPLNPERFTPGPWTTKEHERGSYIIGPFGFNPIALVTSADTTARLIAEAPTMFALLREFMKSHDSLYETPCDCFECEAARNLCKRVLGEKEVIDGNTL